MSSTSPTSPKTTLVTARLYLRPAQPKDAEHLFPAFSDPEVMRYWSEPPHPNLDRSRQWMSSMTSSPSNGVTDFIICVKESDSQDLTRENVIGKIGIYTVRPSNEIGFLLAKEYWGKGYAKEALDALLEYLYALRREVSEDGDQELSESGKEDWAMWREVGHVRLSEDEMKSQWLYPSITADVDPRNAASIGLLKKAGFVENGYGKDTMVIGGESVDSLYLKLEREEWLKGQASPSQALI